MAGGWQAGFCWRHDCSSFVAFGVIPGCAISACRLPWSGAARQETCWRCGQMPQRSDSLQHAGSAAILNNGSSSVASNGSTGPHGFLTFSKATHSGRCHSWLCARRHTIARRRTFRCWLVRGGGCAVDFRLRVQSASGSLWPELPFGLQATERKDVSQEGRRRNLVSGLFVPCA